LFLLAVSSLSQTRMGKAAAPFDSEVEPDSVPFTAAIEKALATNRH
jgi:hypothetical protein